MEAGDLREDGIDELDLAVAAITVAIRAGVDPALLLIAVTKAASMYAPSAIDPKTVRH